MRVGSHVWTFCILFGLICHAPETVSASDTFVFRANSSLQAAALMKDGALHQLRLHGSPGLLLGDLADSTFLAVAVEDTECLMMGIRPTVRLVAYQPNTVVATLVDFTDLVSIFVGNSKVIFQAHGTGGTGVEAADLDALITLNYEPCTAMDVPTIPTSVQISPLGTIRPTGPVDFDVPLFPDSGQLEIVSDDPAHSPILVSLSGRPTTTTTECNIDLNPEALNFGNVQINTTTNLTLQIRNNGQHTCTVTGLNLDVHTAFDFTPSGITPFDVAPGESVTLDVSFHPFVAGSQNDTLTITSSDPANPQQIVHLTGNATVDIEDCRLSVSPLALNFGAVEIGTNKTLSVTVTNSGGAACVLDRTTLIPNNVGFSVMPLGPTNITIAAHSALNLDVTYTPTNTSGAKSTLEIDTAASTGTGTNLTLVSLTATGVVAECRLDIQPTVIDFGAVVVGQGRSRTITISNTGVASCDVFSINGTNGVFALLTPVSFPLLIPPGVTTNLVIDFMPATNGVVNGRLDIVHGNPTNTTEIALTGFGVDEVPGCNILVGSDTNGFEFAFGDIVVGKTNVIKTTISNRGDSICTIHSISLVGSNDLTLISPPTPLDLAPGADFEVAVRYRPTAVGITGGEVDILSTSSNSSFQTIPISGAGVLSRCELTVNTTNVFFGPVLLASNVTATVTLINTNTSMNCTVSSISIQGGGGAFAIDPRETTGRFTLPPVSTNSITIIYTPNTQGTNTATLRIDSEDSVAPILVNLVGIGLRCNLTVSPSALSFGNVTLHGTNTLTLTLRNTGNLTCNVESLTVLGSGRFFVVSPALPFPVDPGQSVPVDVEYRPEHVQTIVIEGGKVRSTGKRIAP